MSALAPRPSESRRLKYVVSLRRSRVDGNYDRRPYIGLEHIESSTGRLVGNPSSMDETPSSGTGQGESLSNTFEPGDVLFGKLRPYLAKAWVAEFPGRCTTELLVMQPVAAEARFLRYVCLWRDFIEAVDASTFGSKMPRADWDFIGNMSVPVPGWPTQVAIADYLDRETARLDALVAAKERVLGLLAEKRRALITGAVTRGLDPHAPLRDSGIPWLGEIPAHWETWRLKHFAAIYYGLSQPPEYADSGIPFLRATNVKRGTLSKDGLVFVDEADLPTSRAIRLRAGDIVVVRSGAYTGDSAIVTEEWQGAVAGYDMVARIWRGADPFFVSHALLCQYVLEAQIDPLRLRAAQPHLNAEELGDIVFAMPPLNEQHGIVAQIAIATTKLDALRVATERTIALLTERRAALIATAVTGQIDLESAA